MDSCYVIALLIIWPPPAVTASTLEREEKENSDLEGKIDLKTDES